MDEELLLLKGIATYGAFANSLASLVLKYREPIWINEVIKIIPRIGSYNVNIYFYGKPTILDYLKIPNCWIRNASCYSISIQEEHIANLLKELHILDKYIEANFIKIL